MQIFSVGFYVYANFQCYQNDLYMYSAWLKNDVTKK